MQANASAARLRELFEYDPLTGFFTWRSDYGGNVAGDRAGGLSPATGYVFINFDATSWQAHRAAWVYMTSELPQNQVDHINGMGCDNRWENLRDVTVQENQQNQRRARVDNKCGLLGVATVRGAKGLKFTAFIRYGGKQHYLGTFRTPETAHAAYLQAKRAHHPACTI